MASEKFMYTVIETYNGNWSMQNRCSRYTRIKRRWHCGFNKDYAIDLCRKLRDEESSWLGHYMVEVCDFDGQFIRYLDF